MTKIFGDYDQAGLDAEYDNRAKVPNTLAMLAGFAERSVDTRKSVAGHLGIAFGSDSEETLDIFLPTNSSGGLAPIQFFIHGGYWKMMKKEDFSYVAGAFTPKSCATAVIN